MPRTMAMDRMLTLRARARHRAGGDRRGAGARPRRRAARRPGGGRRHAGGAQPARCARPHRHRRGRARRGAEALRRRGGRQRGAGRRSTSPATRSTARTICAKNLPNSLAAIAITRRGGLLNAPDVYMEKIAIGPGYPDDLVDLDRCRRTRRSGGSPRRRA